MIKYDIPQEEFIIDSTSSDVDYIVENERLSKKSSLISYIMLDRLIPAKPKLILLYMFINSDGIEYDLDNLPIMEQMLGLGNYEIELNLLWLENKQYISLLEETVEFRLLKGKPYNL